jgi:hypothetical protein
MSDYRKLSSEQNYMIGSQFQFITGIRTLGFTEYFWGQKACRHKDRFLFNLVPTADRFNYDYNQ